jgi:DNA-binding CsgD family transcriptional regulator
MRIWLWFSVAFFCYEIPHDFYEDGISIELIAEATTVFALLVLLHAEWERNQRLNADLGEARADTVRAQAGVQRLSGQFSEYVRAAFERWAFSKSEQEIAWLLLKGFPFAEIATLRGVQERTVRQQATAIYAKSGCKNRNEFLAYFIEDLLAGEAVPATPRREEAPVE